MSDYFDFTDSDGRTFRATIERDDHHGEPFDSNYDESDIAPETLATMRADCVAFFVANESAILCDGGPSTGTASQVEMAGHDFWLNRCGHGAGFWDGDWPEPHASALDAAAQAAGNVDLYLGDDGRIYA